VIFLDLIRNDSQHRNSGISNTGHFQSLVRKVYTVAYEMFRPWASKFLCKRPHGLLWAT